MITIIFFRIDDYLTVGSGWVLSEVLKIHLEISRTLPIRFGCVSDRFDADLAFLDIDRRQYLANIKNSDFNCFLTSVSYYYLNKDKTFKNKLDGSSHKYRDFISKLDISDTGISLKKPVTLDQMKLFLKKNKKNLDLNIHILAMDNEHVYIYENNLGPKKGDYFNV